MPPTRSRAVRRPAPSSRNVVLPLVGGGLALYVVCIGLFALFHYEQGRRPAASRVMRDFHAFLGVGPSAAAAAPTVVAVPPRPVVPPPAPVPSQVERSPLDRIAQTLRRIERDAPKLKQRDRDASFEPARIEVLSALCDARDTLNEILDERPDHDRANRLWDRLQQLLAAVRKL